ncbi:unannotated protein [freshwater metagenome]|uniref:Unannotated protein n=1 Tax=freshwater metagenome TaxID=449393 RepID=A0A6J6NQV9_9ZZZZ
MTGRPQVVTRADIGREADRMIDRVVADLAPAQQPGQDRQTGRIGRGPPLRAQRVRRQVPDRAGAGLPPRALLAGVPGLVEPAAVFVDDHGVPVAVGGATALDPGVLAEGIPHPVALIGVLEADLDARVAGRDDGDRDAVVRPVAVRRPEVGVQVDVARHVREPGVAARMHRQRRDVRVPPAVVGERRARRPRDRCAACHGERALHRHGGCRSPADGGCREHHDQHRTTHHGATSSASPAVAAPARSACRRSRTPHGADAR